VFKHVCGLNDVR